MLLPAKHITLAESLLGFGSHLLSKLNEPMTIDQLWRNFERDAKNYPAYQNFDNLILALDALYAFGAITINESGELMRKKSEASKCA
ncbi:ABC-three component system middle component 6 [Pseudomonas aeruginosa]|uniref:ABC-three component system middle component 6 n=1 Tax=Pseudomonas aeruginosa TaxID=287 RepID=UPI003CF5A5C4